VLGGVAVAALSLVTACSASGSDLADRSTLTAAMESDSLHGGVLRPPDAEPRLVLTDTAGTAYNVEQRDSGKVTLMYFGYTHCPDVCPTTMADIAEALRQSSPTVRRDVTVIFVTVDPHRDSAGVLRHWLDGFSSTFVGLRGSLHSVISAQGAAGLPVSKVAANGKAVEHSAEILAYTPDREAHVIYFEGPSTIEDLAHDLPILVSGKGYGA
jgi:protein SCO1/2